MMDCSIRHGPVQAGWFGSPETLAGIRPLCYTRAMFPLHPRVVHFPVALLATGGLIALAYLLGWRREGLSSVVWVTLFLGWISLFAAILTGLIDQNRAGQVEGAAAILNPHIAAGFALLVVYGLVLYERLRSPQALDDRRLRWRLLALLLLGIALLLIEGWLGGRLVYDLGVGVSGGT